MTGFDMPFVAVAPSAYLADDLAAFVDLPSAYRGRKIKLVPAEASVSKNGVAYFPFETENEVGEWMENVIEEWWGDETV